MYKKKKGGRGKGGKKQGVQLMPVTRVKGGYRWGSSGKVYKQKRRAERQGRAAYAAGYRGKKRKKRRFP